MIVIRRGCRNCGGRKYYAYREERRGIIVSHCVVCSNKRSAAALAKRAVRKRELMRLRKLEVQVAYGGACVCCGETESAFLAIDHVNGNGNQHRKEIGIGYDLYRWLKKRGFPKDGFHTSNVHRR